MLIVYVPIRMLTLKQFKIFPTGTKIWGKIQSLRSQKLTTANLSTTYITLLLGQKKKQQKTEGTICKTLNQAKSLLSLSPDF